MNLLEKYFYLQSKRSEREVSNIDLRGINKNSKLSKLTKIANDNSYFLHSYNGETPKVVLIGVTHKNSEIDQEIELEGILRKSVEKEDLILREGAKPMEIILPSVEDAGEDKDHIIGLRDYFIEKKVRYIFNDDPLLIVDTIITGNAVKAFEKQHGEKRSNKEYLQLITKHMNDLKKRDENFLYNEGVGIIPIANGTTIMHKKPSPDATIFQLFGMGHIYAGFIEENLKKENISFATYVTKY